ncbi:unnamed protein product [Ectocarpus sp. CCAP 1310/34]|nr:unnamed protein product [Ectocarpus sp. CCAP 1310/34]
MPPESDYRSADDGLRHRVSVATPAEMTSAEEPAATNKFTWQEVAKHNSRESAWIIIKDKVYDITNWMDKHPGGSEVVHLMAGRDATDAFASYHPFTNKPQKMLPKFEIGTLVSREFTPYKRDESGFYREMCTRVGQYFEDNKLNPKGVWPGVWRMTLVFACAIAAFLATNGFWPSVPLSVRFLTAALFGVLQALPLLHVMHDSSHTAFGRTQNWHSFGGRLFMDFFAGANLTSWHYQHVVGHHIYTNVFGADPDLPETAEGDPRRLVHRQKNASMYKYQHLYLPPLYGILGLKFRIQDLTGTFFGKTNGPVRVNPISLYRWAEMWTSKVFWALWRICLPLAFFEGVNTPLMFTALFLVSEWMTGYYLAFNFQVSHVSTECDYPLGAEAKDMIEDEWAVSQVKSCVDYAHGSKLVTFLSGALNYQVTHHLFPGVSQYHYPAIAPIIKEVCKEHGVEYIHLDTFTEAMSAHIAHLRNMGRQGIPAEVHMG